jgi:hypothetical protein
MVYSVAYLPMHCWLNEVLEQLRKAIKEGKVDELSCYLEVLVVTYIIRHLFLPRSAAELIYS